MRSGKVTASGMDALVTPLGKVKEGDGPHTYLIEKVTEAWLGGPLAEANTFDMTQGEILENDARPAFTVETNLEVEQVSFITGTDERVGCSPDGIIVGQQAGVEIKCPLVKTHVGYLLNGELPKKYIAQVQFSLYVTGFPKWYFYSYCRNMPNLIIEVNPDPKFQQSIDIAVTEFLERFDEAIEKLVKLNGGVRPPIRQQFQQPELKPKFVSETPT